MKISMYEASVPVLTLSMQNLQAMLRKSAEHISAQELDESVFLSARLFPDMFDCKRQVMIATDMTKGCVARLSGDTPPVFEDDETTIAQLINRCEKVTTYVQSFTADQIDGTEDKEIVLKSPRGEMKFDGLTYLLKFVIPNVNFHATTAYALLRHNGIALSKTDYIGPVF